MAKAASVSTQDSGPRTQDSLIGLAVAALAALVYVNALANELVWDDPIVLERQLLAFRSVGDLIFPPRNIPQFSPDYYRPLTTLSYLIDRAIGGTGPFMFHLSVVLYHVAATYLVFRFGLLLFAATPIALVAAGLGAALFAVHPIHSESVAWGAGRSDVLACGFAVAAAAAYLSNRWTPIRRAAISAALLFVAMLAKETAAALLILIPATDLLLPERALPVARSESRADRRRQRTAPASRPSRLAVYVPFLVAFMLYVALRIASIGSIAGPTNPESADLGSKLLAAIGVYLGKLLLPVRQCAYISDLPTGPLGLLMASALIAGSALLGVVAWRRHEPRVVFSLLWIGLTLAPSLAIIVKIPVAPVAERYLYVPSVGFCLLAGYAAATLLATVHAGALRTATAVGIGVIIAGAAAATVQRNAVWRSNLTLWQDTVAKNTTDALPMRSLATTYQRLGDTAKAAEYFQQALQRRNDQHGLFTLYNNLGSLAMVDKRLDEAERSYRAALALNPQAPDCLFNLGLIALTRATDAGDGRDGAWRRDQAQRARQLFEQAAQLSPLDPDIQVGLGQTLSALDDIAGARARYERALQLGLPPSTEASVRKLLADLRGP